MKRIIAAFAVLCLLGLGAPNLAFAQAGGDQVYQSCGIANYPVGQIRTGTQDPTGKKCVNATVTATASIAAFAPTGQAALTAGTSTSNAALGSVGPTALVTNNGSVTAYINFGASNAVTAMTSSYPVNAGQSVAFNVGSNTYIAAITGSSTAALSVTTGTGLPAIAGGGSGGGGGVVTNAGTFAVQNTAAPSTPASTSSLATAKVICASACHLTSFEVSADSTLAASAWWALIYNATSDPGNGAQTPLFCYAVTAGGNQTGGTFGDGGVTMSVGAVAVASTTGCFTETQSTHAFINGAFK